MGELGAFLKIHCAGRLSDARGAGTKLPTRTSGPNHGHRDTMKQRLVGMSVRSRHGRLKCVVSRQIE
jgi:hypothetical protein